MSDEVRNLSSKLGIDTTDFKTGIAVANRELRLLESGFRAGAATMADWSKDATGLEMRIKSVTGQIDVQKLKVDALQAEWVRLSYANGGNSRAAKEAEISLNKETATLNKMELELKQDSKALTDLKTGSEKAGVGVKNLGAASVSATAAINVLGTAVKASVATMLAMVGVVVAVAAAIGGLVLSTSSASAELTDLSVKTGLSTTALQEYNYIANQTGTSLDTITGAQAKLVRGMSSAQDEQRKYNDAVLAMKDGDPVPELGAAAAAFKTLGVATTDARGQLRSADDVFRESIDALGRIQNPAERDALAMDLFGKSAQELNPLIKVGADDMARMAEEGHRVGAVMSEEDVAAGAAFQDTLDSIKDGLKGVAGTIGALFLPAFQGMASQAQDYLGQFVSVIKGADGDVGKIAEGAGKILTNIAVELAKGAPQMMQAGLGILMTIITSLIAALPELGKAAIEILRSLIDFLVQNAPTLVSAGVPIIMELVNSILPQLPLIVKAALQILIALVDGLTSALPTLIPVVVDVVLQIVETLIDNLPMLIDAALKLIIALATGLIAALPVLIPRIPEIVKAIFNALIAALPMIAEAAVQLIVTLVMGIIGALPQISVAAWEIIKAIFDAIGPAAIVNIMGDIAAGIVDGLIAGWNANWQRMIDNALTGFTDMVAFIRNLLGMHSPSLVFGEIGMNMGKGLGGGLLSELGNVQRQLTGSINGMVLATAGAGGASSNFTDNSNTYYGAVYNVYRSGESGPQKAKRF